jgi:hypothetical protein
MKSTLRHGKCIIGAAETGFGVANRFIEFPIQSHCGRRRRVVEVEERDCGMQGATLALSWRYSMKLETAAASLLWRRQSVSHVPLPIVGHRPGIGLIDDINTLSVRNSADFRLSPLNAKPARLVERGGSCKDIAGIIDVVACVHRTELHVDYLMGE